MENQKNENDDCSNVCGGIFGFIILCGIISSIGVEILVILLMIPLLPFVPFLCYIINLFNTKYFYVDCIMLVWLAIIYISFFCKNLYFYKKGLKRVSFLNTFLYVLKIYIISIIVLFLIKILLNNSYADEEMDFIIASIFFAWLFVSYAVIRFWLNRNKSVTEQKLDIFLGKSLVFEKNKSLIYLLDICADEHEKARIQELYKLEKSKFEEKRIDLFKNDIQEIKLFENKTNDEISLILDDLTSCSKSLESNLVSSYEKYVIIKELEKNYEELWNPISFKPCETENKN